MVNEKERIWPPCGDFRHLRFTTTPDSYPLLIMTDFAGMMASLVSSARLAILTGVPSNPCPPS
jgi:hypothetical protein